MKSLLSRSGLFTKSLVSGPLISSRGFSSLASSSKLGQGSIYPGETAPGPKELPRFLDPVIDPKPKDILIKPYPYKGQKYSDSELKDQLAKVTPPSNVSKEYFIGIASQTLSFLRDEEQTFPILREIEQEIAAQIQKQGVSLENISSTPQYLIPSQGCFLAGPPPEGYRASQELSDAFEKALLDCERKYGINENHDGVRVVGFAKPKDLESVIKQGVVFTDDTQTGSALSHGEYSHRIQMLMIAKAVEKGLIDTHINEHSTIKTKALPFLLSHSSGKSARNIWVVILDNYRDMYAELPPGSPYAIEPETYNLSFRSADVVNSTLCCFGQKMGLPFLGAAMLNAHWKSCQAIMDNLVEKHPELISIPPSILYQRVIPAIAILNDPADAPESKFTMTRAERIGQLLKEGYEQMFGAKTAEMLMGFLQKKPAVKTQTQSAEKVATSILGKAA